MRTTVAFRSKRITASHCRSHQDQKFTPEQLQAQSDAEKKDRAANEEADKVCGEAREQQPGLNSEMLEKDKLANRVAGKVLQCAAKGARPVPAK